MNSRLFQFLLWGIMIFSFVGCGKENEEIKPTSSLKGISFEEESMTMAVEDELTLEPIFDFEGGLEEEVKLTWSSSDEEIATVSNATVTALKEGEVEITAKAATGISASCLIKVTADTSTEKKPITFIPFNTQVTLKGYENGKYLWEIKMSDEQAVKSLEENNGYYIAEGFEVVIEIASKEATFNHGIPVGSYNVKSTSDQDAAKMKHIEWKNGKNFDTTFSTGIVTIEKNDNFYNFTFDTVESRYTHFSSNFAIDHTADSFQSINNTYSSDITEDLIRSTEFTKAVVFRSEPSFYEVYLATEGVTIDNRGSVRGKGEVIQLWISHDAEKKEIGGEYTIKTGKEGSEVFAHTGELSSSFGTTLGCWFFEIETKEDAMGTYIRYKKRAPFKDGTININLEGLEDFETIEKNLTVKIASQDDAIPVTNKIDINYSGTCLYNDNFNTGSFYNAEFIYEGIYGYDLTLQEWLSGKTDNPENKNWTLGLMLPDLYESNGKNGRHLILEMMASPENWIGNESPEGTYTVNVNPRNFDAGSIHRAEIWNVVNGSSSQETNTAVVSGSITIKPLKDDLGRIEVTVNVTDENGTVISGVYTGKSSVFNQAMVPMADRVFNGDDAIIEAKYAGKRDGRSNWTLEMKERSLDKDNSGDIDAYATGLFLSIDIMSDGSKNFDGGLPLGKFEIYEEDEDVANRFGIINSSYTYFMYMYEGAGGMEQDGRKAWTDGHVIIDKDESGKYSIKVDMHSIFSSDTEYVDFEVVGDFHGDIDMIDISRSAQNAKKAAPQQSNIYLKKKHNS